MSTILYLIHAQRTPGAWSDRRGRWPVDQNHVPRPGDCTLSPHDCEILGRYRHSVAFSPDVAGTAVKVKRLDVDLVVYQISEGVVPLGICAFTGQSAQLGARAGSRDRRCLLWLALRSTG